MADSPTLADLRVIKDCDVSFTHGHDTTGLACTGVALFPATREDIIAVIQELGAMKRDAINGTGWAEDWLLEIPSPGRYLIIPLEEE